MTDHRVSQDFFESKYQADSDPWRFADSPYERNRYAEIVNALSGHRFHRAFEPGCSIGALTELLAPVCDTVLAFDISPTAAARAQARCARFPGVTVRVGSLPADIPDGRFDLIVFSEIGYYFDRTTLVSLVTNLLTRLQPGGTLLAAHWLGSSPDHILSGDDVHECLSKALGPPPAETSQCFEGFRLDVWRRP